MIIHDVPQGTTRWPKLRMGIPTTSMFDQIVTPAGKPSSSADRYMHHLLAERILGAPIDGFKSKWMEHGNEFESRAIAAYEFANDVTTRKIGFITTDDGRIGCSPDSFINEHPEGMLEAKAPAPATHVSYLLAANGAGKEYKVQLAGQLWLCEKEWDDIISISPGFPDATFRTYRDEEFIGLVSKGVRAFSDKLENLAADFAARGWIQPEEAPAVERPEEFITDEDRDAILRDRFPGYQEAM